MKPITLDMSNAPVIDPREGVETGDVFRVLGGGERGTRYQLIVNIRGSTCHVLVFNADGEIIGCSQYGVHYMAAKEKVATCEIPVLTPEWFT